MEIGESSEQGCKTWEEELYWRHFYAMHFYQVLPNDFLHHLVLPSKFSENMSGKIPNKLSLIGPGGSSWEVEVSTIDNIAIVGEGWKYFARTFNLEENYLLVFKYRQNLSFEVLIFDQSNSCEMEYSYFVQKGLPNTNDNVDRKRSADEVASTENIEDNIDGSALNRVVSKKPKKCSATDKGKKIVVESPRATPSNKGKEIVVEAPRATPSDKGKKIVVEAPRATPSDMGKESVVEAPRATPSDKAKNSVVEAPKAIPSDKGEKSVVEAPTATPSDLEKKSVVEAPKATPSDQGEKSVVEAPMATPSNQGKKSVVEAHRIILSDDSSSSDDSVDPGFVSPEKVRNHAAVLVSSRGRPLHQVYGSLVPKKAKVSDCALAKKRKNCFVYRRKKKIVKRPITTLADFDSSEKNRADATEVVGRSNEDDDVADETPISILFAGVRAAKSKGQSSAKKPSNSATVSKTVSQHKAIQPTPTGNGENEMCDAVVLRPDNNDYDLSEPLCVEPLNSSGTPGPIRSRKVGAKRGRPVRGIPKSGKKLASKRYKQTLSKEYMSYRRPVTEEEKKATVERATKALTKGSFRVVMRPTSVYRRFFLSIPVDWIKKNLSSQRHKVILRVGEKEWVGKFYNNKLKGHSAGLATGWKNFAIENNLEESDVCVFTPASQKGDDVLIFNVEIFRVVPEVTPLAPVLACSTV